MYSRNTCFTNLIIEWNCNLSFHLRFMTAFAPYCFEDATGWRVYMNSQWSDDPTLMVQCLNASTTTSEEILPNFSLFHLTLQISVLRHISNQNWSGYIINKFYSVCRLQIVPQKLQLQKWILLSPLPRWYFYMHFQSWICYLLNLLYLLTYLLFTLFIT